MQIFSRSDGAFVRHTALVEQTAVPSTKLVQMLNGVGFTAIRNRKISAGLRERHIFMRNRAFFSARV